MRKRRGGYPSLRRRASDQSQINLRSVTIIDRCVGETSDISPFINHD